MTPDLFRQREQWSADVAVELGVSIRAAVKLCWIKWMLQSGRWPVETR